MASGSDARCDGAEESWQHLLHECGAAVPQPHGHSGRVFCSGSVQGKWELEHCKSSTNSSYFLRPIWSVATRLTRGNSAQRANLRSNWRTCSRRCGPVAMRAITAPVSRLLSIVMAHNLGAPRSTMRRSFSSGCSTRCTRIWTRQANDATRASRCGKTNQVQFIE